MELPGQARLTPPFVLLHGSRTTFDPFPAEATLALTFAAALGVLPAAFAGPLPALIWAIVSPALRRATAWLRRPCTCVGRRTVRGIFYYFYFFFCRAPPDTDAELELPSALSTAGCPFGICPTAMHMRPTPSAKTAAEIRYIGRGLQVFTVYIYSVYIYIMYMLQYVYNTKQYK